MSSRPNRQEHFDSQIAKFTHARRRSVGISQAVLAEELGIDQATVSKVEHGLRKLSAGELMQWLEALGMPTDQAMEELSSLWRQYGQRPSTLWEDNEI